MEKTTLSIIRPANCPAVLHRRHEEGCGLLTVSASQIGTVLALVIGALLYLGQMLHKTAPAVDQSEDVYATEFFWTILFLSALYYLIAEWVLEERDYHKLRNMSPRRRAVEFWWRVALGALFGVAVAGLPEFFFRELGGRIHASTFALLLIYAGFLLWDLIVATGGQVEMAWRVVRGDFVGLLLVAACLWTHENKAMQMITFFLAGALIVVIWSSLRKALAAMHLWHRITNPLLRR